MSKISIERNLGIDFLRIVAMLMIVLLHVTGFVWKDESTINHQEKVASALNQFLYLSCMSCVNIYAMISGYVQNCQPPSETGYMNELHISRLLKLCFQIVFYSVGICLILRVFGLEKVSIGESFYLARKYWYTTSYLGIVFLMPLLNTAIWRYKLQDLEIIFVLLFIVYSCIGRLGNVIDGGGVFGLGYGYCSFWLLVCYILGGIIARYVQNGKINLAFWLWILIGIEIWYGIWEINICFLERRLFPVLGIFSGGYLAPLSVCHAVAMVVVFSQMKIKHSWKRAMIGWASPLTLGCYLIHVHPKLFDQLSKNAMSFNGVSIVSYLGITFGVTFCIYISCSLIDYGRLHLFKFCRIHQLCYWVEHKVCR